VPAFSTICGRLKGVGFPRHQVEKQNTLKTQLKMIGKCLGRLWECVVCVVGGWLA